MKLLCICPIGIGNYLLCYPAWTLLRRHLPDVELHLLALRKPILDLAGSDPLWDHIHSIDPTKQRGMADSLPFIAQLKKERYDGSLSYFPSNTWQYNLLPFCAGVKKRFAFSYRFKRMTSGSLLNSSLLAVDPRLHDVEQNIRLSTHFLKIPVPKETVSFPTLFTEKELDNARKELPEGAARYIAVHPGSSAEHGMDAKRWPAARFAELADRAASILDAHTLILGGPDELFLKQEVDAAMHTPCTVITPRPLSLTAALLIQCSLCICNDSGIMHLAACGGTATAALFGPTDEQRNGPYGANHCIIRKKDAPPPLWTAENVGNRKVPHGTDPRQWLLDLSTDEAWQQLEPFLHRHIITGHNTSRTTSPKSRT